MPTRKLNELSYTCVGRLISDGAENIPDEYKTSWNAFVIALFGMGDKLGSFYPYIVGIQIITDMTGEHKTYKRVFFIKQMDGVNGRYYDDYSSDNDNTTLD